MVLCSLSEQWLGISSSEAIKELLIWLREAVIDLIARSPNSVCKTCQPRSTWTIHFGEWEMLTATKSWEISELQDSIVGWVRLKCDVRVPTLIKTLVRVPNVAIHVRKIEKLRNWVTSLLERLLLLVLLSLAVTEDLGGQVIADNAMELLVL